LAEDFNRGSFHAGAGGAPGIPHHNQCDESIFRSIKRVIPTKATVEYFFEKSVPDMIYHLGLHFSCSNVSRGVDDQQARVMFGHLHRDILEKTYMYCQEAKKNIMKVKV
jgi:hypothetical protein